MVLQRLELRLGERVVVRDAGSAEPPRVSRRLESRGVGHPDSPLVRSQRADFPHWAHDRTAHFVNGAKKVHGALLPAVAGLIPRMN